MNEPTILDATEGPRVSCSKCGAELLGRGWLEHYDDGSHSFYPAAVPGVSGEAELRTAVLRHSTDDVPECSDGTHHTLSLARNIMAQRPGEAKDGICPHCGQYAPCTELRVAQAFVEVMEAALAHSPAGVSGEAEATALGNRIINTLHGLGLNVRLRDGYRPVPQSDIAIAVQALFAAHPSPAGAPSVLDVLDERPWPQTWEPAGAEGPIDVERLGKAIRVFERRNERVVTEWDAESLAMLYGSPATGSQVPAESLASPAGAEGPIDVERLGKAIDIHFDYCMRGHRDPDGVRELATRVATEYARLSPAPAGSTGSTMMDCPICASGDIEHRGSHPLTTTEDEAYDWLLAQHNAAPGPPDPARFGAAIRAIRAKAIADAKEWFGLDPAPQAPADSLDAERLARAQDNIDKRHHDPEIGPYRGLDNDPIIASMAREEAAELIAEYARLDSQGCGVSVACDRPWGHDGPHEASLDAADWESISLALGSFPTWFPETVAKVDAIRSRLDSQGSAQG